MTRGRFTDNPIYKLGRLAALDAYGQPSHVGVEAIYNARLAEALRGMDEPDPTDFENGWDDKWEEMES